MFHASDYKKLLGIYLSFVIPSIGSQLLSGIYTIVDGFFIGMGLGDSGLAAVGLAFPFSVFVTAIGAGIGVGGGALISISMGRGRKILAERILASMALMILCASAASAICFTALSGPLLSMYDVSPTIAEMACDYAWILLAGSPAQVFAMGFLGAVRNDGFPRKAMVIMIFGFLLNIFLDWMWVIVFPLGIAGAAWATVTSQALTALMFVMHFASSRSNVKLRVCKMRFCGRLFRKIALLGFAPFGVHISTALTMIMHNWQVLQYGGDLGVAAYAVVGYIVPVGVMLQEGIAEGIQPLISYYHGANLLARRRYTARMGFTSALVVGLICSLAILLSSSRIPFFFSMGLDAAPLATRGLFFSTAMYPFLGIAKVGSSYFQSIGKVAEASFLTYGDPIVLLPFFLWVLPLFLGLDGVWLAMSCANLFLAIIFTCMWKKESYRKQPFNMAIWRSF